MHRRSRRVKGGGRVRTWERSGAAQRALDAPGCLRQPTTDLASRRGWVGGGRATAMPRVAGSRLLTCLNQGRCQRLLVSCPSRPGPWTIHRSPGRPDHCGVGGPKAGLASRGSEQRPWPEISRASGAFWQTHRLPGTETGVWRSSFILGQVPAGCLRGRSSVNQGARSGSCCSRGCRCK